MCEKPGKFTMIDYIMFIIAILSIALALILYVKIVKKTKIKGNAMSGIVGFLLFGIIIGGVAQCAKADDLKWFAYGEVYLGLDLPFSEKSPQCETVGEDFDNGADDKITSNGGLRLNIIKQGGFEVNSYYLHKSCAVADDDLTYDAYGIEAAYKLWSR